MWTLHGGCVVVLVVEQSSRQIEYFVVGKYSKHQKANGVLRFPFGIIFQYMESKISIIQIFATANPKPI